MKSLMKCKNMIAFFIILFLCVGSVAAHYDTAYWNEDYALYNNSRWMSKIPDSRRVSQLSIPGTHDTMAYSKNLIVSEISRTQAMDLWTQLLAGVRYLDIRLTYKGDHFSIHHGIIWTGYSFDDVLSTVQRYLQYHPTETIFMRIKQEHTSVSDSKMLDLFNRYVNRYPNLFWRMGNSNSPQNPTLRELRGKVCVMSEIWSINIGMNYRGLDIQDSYHLNTNWELHSKWDKIKAQLIKANDARANSKTYLNYLSASGGVFPYFVASGHSSSETGAPRLLTGKSEPFFRGHDPDFPRVGWFLCFASIAFEGTNTLTANYIDRHKLKYVGIVAGDFMGPRLINAIIACNSRY